MSFRILDFSSVRPFRSFDLTPPSLGFRRILAISLSNEAH